MAKAFKIVVEAVVAVGLVVAGVATGNPALIAAGLAVGNMAVSQATQKKPPVPESQIDRLTATIDPRAPRKSAFGHTALATDVRYQEWFSTNQEKCGWIVALASHKIESVEQIWLNDEMAWSLAGGVVSKFSGYFWVQHTILEGTSGNAFSFGSGVWNTTRRLTGCAYVHLEFKVTGNSKTASSPFSSGIPSRMTIIGKGGMVYDPRLDSTAGGSGAMRAADQTTWAYTVSGTDIGENIALQVLRELLGWKINGKLAVGSGLPPKRIDMASFIVAANYCDELVAKAAGGTEPRFRGAGVLSEADDPQTRINTMLAACCGRLRDTGGKIALVIMHNDLAAASTDDGLNEDDVVGAFTWNPDPALAATPNIARGKFTDPSTNSLYQLIDYPDVGFTSGDGIDRAMTFDLAWCQSASQAQRCVKQVLERRQYARTFESTFDIRSWKYGVGDVVPFTFSPLGFDRRLFRVKEIDPRSNPVPVVLEEESASIYLWDASDRAPVTAAAPIVYDTTNDPLVRGITARGAYQIVSQSVSYPYSVGDSAIAVSTFAATLDDGTTITLPGGSVTGLTSGVTFGLFYRTSTSAYVATAYPAAAEWASNDNIFIRWLTTSAAGVFPDPDAPPAGDGGDSPNCVTDDTLILMGDGSERAARDLRVGDMVRTRHEKTLEWGEWPIEAIRFAIEPIYAATIGDAVLRGTREHRVWIDGAWVILGEIGLRAGKAQVAKITVADAHTYVSAGILSHNIKRLTPETVYDGGGA